MLSFGRSVRPAFSSSSLDVYKRQGAIRCIKKHPIAERKLKTVTAEHLQAFLDLLTFGGEDVYKRQI